MDQLALSLYSQGISHRGFSHIFKELSGNEVAREQQLPHRAIQRCLVHKARRLIAYVRHQHKAPGIQNPLYIACRYF